jgi:hypothetical protein
MLQLVKPAGPLAANKYKLNDRFIGDLQPRSKPFLVFDSVLPLRIVPRAAAGRGRNLWRPRCGRAPSITKTERRRSANLLRMPTGLMCKLR